MDGTLPAGEELWTVSDLVVFSGEPTSYYRSIDRPTDAGCCCFFKLDAAAVAANVDDAGLPRLTKQAGDYLSRNKKCSNQRGREGQPWR